MSISHSKNITAAQTNIFTQGSEVCDILPEVSGSRKKTFSQYLLEPIKGSSAVGALMIRSAPEMVTYLGKMITIMAKKIGEAQSKGGQLVSGTTTWKHMEGGTFVKGEDGADMKTEPTEPGACSWSNIEY